MSHAAMTRSAPVCLASLLLALGCAPPNAAKPYPSAAPEVGTAVPAADPELEPAFIERARLKAERDDPVGAIVDYTRAVELSSTSTRIATALFEGGQAREAAGDPEGARADFERTLEIDPDHVEARKRLES